MNYGREQNTPCLYCSKGLLYLYAVVLLSPHNLVNSASLNTDAADRGILRFAQDDTEERKRITTPVTSITGSQGQPSRSRPGLSSRAHAHTDAAIHFLFLLSSPIA